MESEKQHLKNLRVILQYNLLVILLVIFCLFYVIFFTKCIKYESKYTGSETTITGKITEFSLNGDKLKMMVSAKEDVIVTYYLASEEEKSTILNYIGIGKTVKLNGNLTLPKDNSIPNNFNYRNYLYQQKIFYLFAADNFEIIKDNNIIDKTKDYLIKRAYKLENSDYILALVLGDKALLSNEEYNLYQENGTSHLLAISGSHVSVLLAIFGIFLKKTRPIIKLSILSFILLFFSFVTSFQVAVSRAVIFFILNSLNKILNLNYSNLNVLVITACIILLFDPFAIYDLGFIYSFAVCGGIIYNQDKIKGNYLVRLLRLSFISFLFSMPISAYINYEINIMSILVNMIFVPWISTIVFPLAIVTYIIPIINPILSFTLNITSIMNELLAKFQLFINVPKMSILVVALLFILLVLSKKYWQSYLAIILVILFVKLSPKLDNNFYVYYLDVGQGDSSVLITPGSREAIMIDTGGLLSYQKEDWAKGNKGYNLSDNTIKFLKSLGITKLDYLIITHGDYDHAKEALNITKNFKVKRVILNCGEYNDLEQDIIKELDRKNIPHYSCISNLNIAKNRLYFLNTEDFGDENENSIVIYTKIDNVKLLFMADAGIKKETSILEKYNLSDIDIIKVGHHGSDTSSGKEFISSITPRNCVISVGENNRYGHPKESVLDTLKNYCNIYRTDLNKTVKVTINNGKYKIETGN